MEVKNQTLIWLNARGEDNEHDEGPQSQQTKTFITQSCQLQNEGYLNFITAGQICYRVIFHLGCFKSQQSYSLVFKRRGGS